MSAPDRARKMAERIKEIVARRLEKGLRDDRLGFVTITDVRVTGDLQHATIFFTVYGTDEERQNSWDALKSATGMMRSEVGRNITARLTPSLEFILDALPETSAAPASPPAALGSSSVASPATSARLSLPPPAAETPPPPPPPPPTSHTMSHPPKPPCHASPRSAPPACGRRT
jgi:ribosome-binding factor A